MDWSPVSGQTTLCIDFAFGSGDLSRDILQGVTVRCVSTV